MLDADCGSGSDLLRTLAMMVAGYTCGLLGRLDNEEGYGLRSVSVHFPSTTSPSSKGGTLVLVYTIV